MVPSDIPPEAAAAQERADQCLDERRFVDAIAPAEEAARLHPGWSAPWWTLTAAYKHAHRWRDVLAACDRAVAINPDDAQGPLWNAGIAATALGDWPRARSAWTSAGISLPPGEGPLEMGLGPTPIRVSVDGSPDVVWCDRLDPCRARILSVPIPDCERRYGDLLLHDGEPRGKRRWGQRNVSVFDELIVLEASPFHTWQVMALCQSPLARDQLFAELHDAGLVVEDWTENLYAMCAVCSLNNDPPAHDHPPPAEWDLTRRLGVAARSSADLHPLRRGTSWRPEVVSVEQLL